MSFITVYLSSHLALEALLQEEDKERMSAANLKSKHLIKKSPDQTKTDCFNLSYDHMCEFKEEWMLACRGTYVIPGQKPIYAFNKFFNQHESKSVVQPQEGALLVYSNKFDGSLIRVWYDFYDQNLRIATQGSVNPAKMFTDPVQRLLDDRVKDYLKNHPYDCLLGELMTDKNKVVTDYGPGERFTPFAIVDYETGLPSWKLLRSVLPELFDAVTGLPTFARSANETEQDEFIRDVVCGDEDAYGKWPEGAVLYEYNLDPATGLPDVAVPIMKIKRSEYVALHNGQLSKNSEVNAQLAVINGTYDDLPTELSYYDECASTIKSWCEEIEKALEEAAESKRFKFETKNKILSKIMVKYRYQPRHTTGIMVLKKCIPRIVRLAEKNPGSWFK